MTWTTALQMSKKELEPFLKVSREFTQNEKKEGEEFEKRKTTDIRRTGSNGQYSSKVLV